MHGEAIDVQKQKNNFNRKEEELILNNLWDHNTSLRHSANLCSSLMMSRTDRWLAREMSEEEVPPAEPPPTEGGEVPAPAAAEEPQPTYRPSRDPDRPLKFRYWSRPTTLQYKYLYDYRHNYYSDVIDYLDNRSRGIKSDIPRPQTWAERALRTYTNPKKSEALAKRQKDIELLNNIRASNFLYQYHTKDYLYRKYPALTL